MDLEGIFNGTVDYFQQYFGISGPVLFSTLAVLSIICRYIGKSIPDDKTGFLGVVRTVCKVIGLYVSNRITAGVSVTDVSKVVADARLSLPDPESGKFTSTKVVEAAREVKSHWIAGIIAIAMALLLMGCTAQQTRVATGIANSVCQNTAAAQMVLDQFAESRDRVKAQHFLDALKSACPVVLLYLDYRNAQAAGVVDAPATN